MKTSLAVFFVVHGLIHLIGFVKGFGLADLPQMAKPIPPTLGALWLAAALLFLATAAALFVVPRWWWAVGAAAIVVSMVAIAPSWADAKLGALADLVALLGVLFGFLVLGPSSLRAEYDRDVARALRSHAPAGVVREADLAGLPPPVQQYLRRTGAVGKPRVRNFRARMHGRIRGRRDGRWMPFTAEQYNVLGEPARFFYMTASLFGLPAQGYHRYLGPSATMRVKAAGLVPVLDVSGPEMDQGETVTMFNDICIMAPAALIDAPVQWEPIDGRTVRARFTNAGQTIAAALSFDEAGDLSNFWSDDRYQASADGRTMRRLRWSTPVRRYRSFGDLRLSSGGDARWHDPAGEFAYIELTLDDVRHNVPAPAR